MHRHLLPLHIVHLFLLLRMHGMHLMSRRLSTAVTRGITLFFVRRWTLDVGRWTFSFFLHWHQRHPALRAFSRRIHHDFRMHDTGVLLLRRLRDGAGAREDHERDRN